MSATRAEVARAVGSVMRGVGAMPNSQRLDVIYADLEQALEAKDLEKVTALFAEAHSLQAQAIGLLVPLAAGALDLLADIAGKDPVAVLDQVLAEVTQQ